MRFKPVASALAEVMLRVAGVVAAGAPLTAWPLLWPDAQERFPGEADVDPGYANVQDLGRVAAKQADGAGTLH